MASAAFFGDFDQWSAAQMPSSILTRCKTGTGSNFAVFAKLRACPRFALGARVTMLHTHVLAYD